MEKTQTLCLSDHYVEVVYFENNQWQSRKLFHYEKTEAESMYTRALNKLTLEGTSCLVSLRNDNHELIHSQLLNYTQIKLLKKVK